jgi:C-terminal processing protease CtpA/Prc
VVTVDVRRNGKDMQYQVELRNQGGTTDITKKADSEFYEELGANFAPVPAELQKKLGISNGMQVTEVGDGMLQRGGVQPGFIILQINDLDISSVSDIEDAMNDIEGGVIRIEGVYPNGMRMSYGFVL